MNILFVTHYTGLGGANIAMLNLIQQYKNRGIRAYVILPENGGVLKEKLEELSIEYAQIRMPWWICVDEEGNRQGIQKRIKNYLGNYRGALKISLWIRRWKIDVVHTNSTVVAAGMLAAEMTGCHHVWHLREDLSNYGWKFSLHESRVRKWFARSARVIVISKACEKVYEKYLNPEKTVLIYDGAQIADRKESPILEEGVFHILYLGGMSLSKGYEDVLKAATLLKRHTGRRFKLWMPGCKESDKVDKELERILVANKLEDYVVPLEYLDRKQLDQFRYGMNLFIMASSREMFGLVTAEAMMSGVPVIASDAGANSELIKDGENGFLYPYGDAEALAGTIQEVMNKDEKELAVIVEKARCEAQKKFSMENCAEKTIQVYREILRK